MFAFDWNPSNLEHIARHGVTPAEAEEVVYSNPLALGCDFVDGEFRFEEIGRTRAGRILKVVTTEREGKIRVVTAFESSPTEKSRFLASEMNS